MKNPLLLVLCIGLCSYGASAKPTENRQWTAANGQTVQAVATAIEGDRVVLEKEGGGVAKVPIDMLVVADRALLTKHFELDKVSGSGAKKATGLRYKPGEVSGPVNAGNSSYYLYLPESLKQGRKAPLLYYTHSGGGTPKLLKEIMEGAELGGWIMAMSVESKNKASVDDNVYHNKDSVKHILQTLPVDKDRVYFTGNSGGGAAAWRNASEMNVAGVMPNVGYIPSGASPKGDDFFIIGGGRDYNRYHSANARKKFGERAIHRMHPGAHGVSPPWLMIDGMIWFEGRNLARNKAKHLDEAKDFDAAMIQWLEGKKKSEPYRAYSTGRFLMDEYRMGGAGKMKLQLILAELEKNPVNVAYYEGLKEIDNLSLTKLSKLPKGESIHNHVYPDVQVQVVKLLEKYTGVPVIEDTLKAIARETP